MRTLDPLVDEAVVAVIERKTLENLANSLSEGSLAFQMQRLAEVARAAIVVEGDYPDLFRTQPGRGSWLADMLARVAVRYPEFRSSSLDRGGSPRNGLSASSELLLPIARDLLSRKTQPQPLFERKPRTLDVIFEPHRRAECFILSSREP